MRDFLVIYNKNMCEYYYFCLIIEALIHSVGQRRTSEGQEELMKSSKPSHPLKSLLQVTTTPL